MDALVIKSQRGKLSLGFELTGFERTGFELAFRTERIRAPTASIFEEIGRIEAAFHGGIEEVLDPPFHTPGLRVEVALRAARIGLEEVAERVATRSALSLGAEIARGTEVTRCAEREGLLRFEEIALEATLLVELEDRTAPAIATLRGSERISLRARTEGIATEGIATGRAEVTRSTHGGSTHHHGKEVVIYCTGVFAERLEASELRLAPRAIREVVHVTNRTLSLIIGAEPSSGCKVSTLAESEALIAAGERIT